MSKYYSKIRVQYSDGEPARGIKVSLSIDGFLSGGVVKGYTNNSGDVIIGHESTGTADIIINGRSRGNLKTPGETVVFI